MAFTDRDRAVVEWLGRLGAARAEHVMQQFALGRTVAYRRLQASVGSGLLTHVRLVHGEPGVYVASREGLRWAGLGDYEVCRVSLALWRHWIACADAAIALRAPAYRVRSERKLRAYERRGQRTIGSVPIGNLPGGRKRLHRPDLVVSPRTGDLPTAVELELSVKSNRRLDTICRAYARSRLYERVVYYAEPEPARAVSKAIERTRTADVIEVRPVEEVTSYDADRGLAA